MKHDWYLLEDGSVDIFRLEYDYHNGPECRRCGNAYCHHCDPNTYGECPSNQLDLPFDDVVQ